MKKITLFTILTLQLFGSSLIAQTATAPASGDGTVGNPYQIATLDNLFWLTQNDTEWDKAFIQIADIDASSTTSWDGGQGFTPIGVELAPFGGGGPEFTGSYNGSGHTINNLFMDRNNPAMFAHSNSASIENLGLTNVNISGPSTTGCLALYFNEGTINNCYSTGVVNSGAFSTGNLARTGGLVAFLGVNSVLSRCYSTAAVMGGRQVGGLIGASDNTSITSNCYTTGSVTCSGSEIGGINGTFFGTMTNCYSTGTITGTTFVGGLTGYNGGTVTNSFWDTQTSGNPTSSGGTGKTTAEMQDIATFTNAAWDFANETTNGTNDYWSMPCGGNNYPKLTWQNFNLGLSATGTDTRTECNSFTWIDGSNYTASNNSATFNIVGGAANGCDSLVTLDLTIINSATGTDTRTECNSYTWIDGNNYTASNNSATFNIVGGAANGCDSLVTLDLTIINSATGTDTRTECNSYTWIDGNNYTASNNSATFNIVGGASNGCDSLVTLDLTINSVSDLTTSVSGVTISANNTGATYQWLDCDNGYAIIPGETNQSYTSSTNGNYAVELTENGCADTSACVAITTVGILENSFGDDLIIYPNPTSGNFSIVLGASFETSVVSITDISGKLIDCKTIIQSQILNLSIKAPAGIYFVSVLAGGKKAVVKLVKQ